MLNYCKKNPEIFLGIFKQFSEKFSEIMRNFLSEIKKII